MATSTKITLKIVRKVYKSGTPYFHLTGRICGRTYQENFPTQDEAEVAKRGYTRAALQVKSAPQTRLADTIFLTDLDLHAAELAFTQLRAALPNASLTTAVDFYLANHTVTVTHLKAEEAVEKFCKQRLGRGNQEETAGVTKSVLGKFIGWKRPKEGQPALPLKIKTTEQITREVVKEFVFDTSVGLRSRRDRHDLLHNFFEFLVAEKHMAKNLVDEIDRPVYKKVGDPTIFTVAQCQALLNAAATEPGGRNFPVKGAMLPYFAICMLSGMRPDEAQRLKADWSNIVFENKVILGFRGKIGVRQVALHDQLPGILQQCKDAGLRPGYFLRDVFERIQCKAGVRVVTAHENAKPTVVTSWDNDILRHGYASYTWARQDSPDFITQHKMGFLMQNMGNSERVLKRSYINGTVLAAAGAAYFKMQPANMAGLGTSVSRTQAKPKQPEPAPAAPTLSTAPATPSLVAVSTPITTPG